MTKRKYDEESLLSSKYAGLLILDVIERLDGCEDITASDLSKLKHEIFMKLTTLTDKIAKLYAGGYE